MSLFFKNGLYLLSTDQTPTPTRFLRNCEEVGLFSDLELDQTSEEEEEDTKQVKQIDKMVKLFKTEQHKFLELLVRKLVSFINK